MLPKRENGAQSLLPVGAGTGKSACAPHVLAKDGHFFVLHPRHAPPSFHLVLYEYQLQSQPMNVLKVRTGEHVKVGASVPGGLAGCRLLTDLKLGNLMLTLLPMEKDEALAVADYCGKNRIYLIFSELVWRGTFDLGWAARKRMSRGEFYAKPDLDEICRATGEYYLGRITVGEIGGLLYAPKAYWINRAVGEFDNLPAVETVDAAKQVYLDDIRRRLGFEGEELGGRPFLDVDAGCTFKYQLEAGIDIPLLEAMPGDCTLMTACIRGAAKAYAKPRWGIHIAMACYGGVSLDAIWQKRWKISLYSGFMAGSDFIYPESGHFTYHQVGGEYAFNSPEMREARRILREFNQFTQIHSRPANGPKVKLGFVYGNLDGYPGLWNKYVWGQYADDKWRFGPAEWGWECLDDVYRKGRWDDENIQGDVDFHGNPPYGQYDVVPIEAPLSVLGDYSCLVFLGWNTMTSEIYEKLKAYVEAGGRLFMSVPHLSVETDRGKDLKLYHGGDWRDLFGVRVNGKGKAGVAGIKTFRHSSIPSYRMPVWHIRADPRFIGNLTLAKTELHGAKVISGWSDFYHEDESKLTENPVLTEFSLGQGKSFLLNSWTYPGDRGWRPYVTTLLRVISAGEQGDVRIIGSDRIRYAIYEGEAPSENQSASKINTIYLLNTEYDTPHLADLWIAGKVCRRLLIEPTAMNVVYRKGSLALASDDRGVEIESWEHLGAEEHIALFCRKDIVVRAFNLSDQSQALNINGGHITLAPGAEEAVAVVKRIDPAREEFFAPDFLQEPEVAWTGSELPY